MRFKEFVIFIIIFTIIYFLGFYIHDYFINKKDLEKRETEIKSLIDINKYHAFCCFYGIVSVARIEILNSIYEEAKSSIQNNLLDISNRYSIDLQETIVIILFLEYFGLIAKRKILIVNNCCVPLDENDEALILQYSLHLKNKLSFGEIYQKKGMNTERELIYMSNYYLIPGVIYNEKTLVYVGDFDE